MSSRLWLLLSLGLLLTFALAHAVCYALPFEDSFITFRYAENLAHGHGLVWNPGERVEGCSSLAWTLLLSACAWFGLPLPATSVVLSLLAGIALVLVTCALAQRGAEKSAFALTAPAIVAAHGTFAYFSASGMEAPLFAAVIAAAAWVVTFPHHRAAALAGVLLGLATWIRPEGVGYLGLFAIALSLSRAERRNALPLLLTGALCVAPLFAVRLWYFGYPLPNTWYAKATPSRELFQTGLVYALDFALSTGFAALLGAVLLVRKTRKLEASDRLTMVLALGAFANAVLVGGDTFAFYRTFLPVIAPVAATFSRALLLQNRTNTRVGISLLAVAWALGGTFLPRLSVSGLVASNFSATRGVSRINEDYFRVGRFLREALPPEAWIAVNAAGIVPYVSGLRTIDMLGLNDVHIAHHPVPRGEAAAIGHQKHDAAYVLGRRPDVIIPGLPVLSPAPLAPEDIGRWYSRYAPFLPGDRELFRNPDLARLYRPVVLPVGSAYLPLFVRRAEP